ncbi:hypothetical protein AHAS_Ahas11G0193900 [Arachis hypogaea]
MEEQQQSWREQEIRLQKMDEQLENMGKCSDPLSKENEDQFVGEEVEEQEIEEDNQGRPFSSEAENHMKEGLMEPPVQEALNEGNTPKITQQPCLEFKDVKAINKSTEKRIVTKIPRTTFKRRSTTSNPTPKPLASKLSQAIRGRK